MSSLFPELDVPAKPYELGWDGTPMLGTLEAPIAFDTETWAVDEDGEKLDLRKGPPRIVLATISAGAGDGVRNLVLHPSELPAWILAHREQHLVGHNFAFDFWVVLDELKRQEALWLTKAKQASVKSVEQNACALACRSAIDAWWENGERGQFHDTMLLDLLVMLAEGKNDDGSESLEIRNLGALAKQYAPKVPVNKEDPFRLRYHEVAAIPFEQWEADVDPGFFKYAIDDARATRLIWEKLLPRAQKVQAKHLPAPGQKCFAVYPDAPARFGVLTEQIQVKGAIALQSVTHNGMLFDPERAQVLEEKTRKEVKKGLRYLKKTYPGLFTKNAKGEIKLQEKSRLPSLSTQYLKGVLQALAHQYAIEAPQSGGKLKGISISVKEWAEHKGLDPFFDHWITVGINAKLLGFFDALKKAQDRVIRSNYRVLVRTGRTSCSSPNAQQYPRTAEFRAMFVAGPGRSLVTIDYGAVELRTLATVCKMKLGHSKLAEVFSRPHGKDDPHAFTAAMIKKVPFEEFLTWKDSKDEKLKKEFKRTRQASKACFHPDVEILTRDGWRKVSQLTGSEQVAQFVPATEDVEFVYPLALTERDEQPLVRVWNESIDVRVTPDHRMVGLHHNGKPLFCPPSDMNKKFRSFWNAGTLRSMEYLEVDPVVLQQIVALQADGYIDHWTVDFAFRKERKISRLNQLFPNVSWKKYLRKDGKYDHVGVVPWDHRWDPFIERKGKLFKLQALLALSPENRRIFIDELAHWDSKIVSHRSFNYTTTSKENSEVIQQLCALSGRKISFTARDSKQPNRQRSYTLSIKDRAYSRSSVHVDELPGTHKVYCLSVPSECVVVRDRGKIVITGNCNFGIPGGLAKDKLSKYAKQSYEVEMSPDEADLFRSKIINEIYPELNSKNGYLSANPLLALSRNTGVQISVLQEHFKEKFGGQIDLMLHLCEKVSKGITVSKKGKQYSESTQGRIWEALEFVADNSTTLSEEHIERIRQRKGSPKLASALFSETTCTLTGRIRGKVYYTQARNTPFQSLAADGMKLAMWRLVKQGYRIIASVHDELVVDVPEASAEEDLKVINNVMVEEMERVLTPPGATKPVVPVKCEGAFGKEWAKP